MNMKEETSLIVPDIQIASGRIGHHKQLELAASQLAMIMPSYLEKVSFLSGIHSALRKNNKLAECSSVSFMSAAIVSVRLGLSCDPALGEGYLVPFGGEVVFIPGYRGLGKLIYNTGMVSGWSTGAVYPEDDFDWQLGSNAWVHHKPSKTRKISPPKEVSYYYATVTTVVAGKEKALVEVMSRQEVEAHRDEFSKQYGSLKKKWIKAKRRDIGADVKKFSEALEQTVWYKHPVSMGRKTPLRRLSKTVPASPSNNLLQLAAEVDGRSERGLRTTMSINPSEPTRILESDYSEKKDDKNSVIDGYYEELPGGSETEENPTSGNESVFDVQEKRS